MLITKEILDIGVDEFSKAYGRRPDLFEIEGIGNYASLVSPCKKSKEEIRGIFKEVFEILGGMNVVKDRRC